MPACGSAGTTGRSRLKLAITKEGEGYRSGDELFLDNLRFERLMAPR